MSPELNKKIPKVIKFGAYKYEIILDKDEFLRAKSEEKTDCDAMTVFTGSKIYLNPKNSYYHTSETLLHELCHIAYFHGGLDDRTNPTEEDIVNIMSFHLLTVLKDNPKLVEYLFAKD